MTKAVRILVPIFGAFLLYYAVQADGPQSDSQFRWRNEVEVTIPLRAADIALESELDLTAAGRFAEWQGGPDVTVSLADNLSGAAGYLFEVSPSGKVKHGPQATATWRAPSIAGFTPSVRNRLLFGRGSLLYRYRGRLQVARDVQMAGQSTRLFVSNEVFFDWERGAWIRNRFTAGGSRRVAKNFSVVLGFQRETNRNSATIHRLNIGIDVELSGRKSVSPELSTR